MDDQAMQHYTSINNTRIM